MGAGPAASRPVSTVSRAPRGVSTLHAVAAGNHTAQPEPALGKLSFGALSVFRSAASRPVSTVSRAPRGVSTLHAVAAGNHTAQPEPALGKLSFGALSVFDTE